MRVAGNVELLRLLAMRLRKHRGLFESIPSRLYLDETCSGSDKALSAIGTDVAAATSVAPAVLELTPAFWHPIPN